MTFLKRNALIFLGFGPYICSEALQQKVNLQDLTQWITTFMFSLINIASLENTLTWQITIYMKVHTQGLCIPGAACFCLLESSQGNKRPDRAHKSPSSQHLHLMTSSLLGYQTLPCQTILMQGLDDAPSRATFPLFLWLSKASKQGKPQEYCK